MRRSLSGPKRDGARGRDGAESRSGQKEQPGEKTVLNSLFRAESKKQDQLFKAQNHVYVCKGTEIVNFNTS